MFKSLFHYSTLKSRILQIFLEDILGHRTWTFQTSVKKSLSNLSTILTKTMTLACCFFSHLDPVNASQIPTQLATRSAVIAGILEATSLGCHRKLVEQIQNTKPPKWEEFLHRTVRWGSRRYVPGLCYKNPKTQTLGYVLGGYLEKVWKNPRIQNTKLQKVWL